MSTYGMKHFKYFLSNSSLREVLYINLKFNLWYNSRKNKLTHYKTQTNWWDAISVYLKLNGCINQYANVNIFSKIRQGNLTNCTNL